MKLPFLLARGRARRSSKASDRSRAAGYRKNLLILHTLDQQARSDWEIVKAKIEALAPDIEVRIDSNDAPSPGIERWQVSRPSLVFSPFRLLAYRPPAGKIYTGRLIGKIAEWQRLMEFDLPVPRTVRLVPGLELPSPIWGDYVVVKPVIGQSGQIVRLMRREDVAPRYDVLTGGGRRRMLVQAFVDSVGADRRPVHYRALTLFGEPLSLRAIYWTAPRRPLAEIAADSQGAIATNADEIPGSDSIVDIPDVLALSRRVAAAFPEIPCLGQDIRRQTGTGELFILETNPGGATWHFSSAAHAGYIGHDEEYFRARYDQFDALNVVARQLIARTRAEAE